MLRKMIKYTDYNGVEREEPFYFNLNKVEASEFQYSYPEGLDKAVQKFADNGDNLAMMRVLEDLILRSYGEKSTDGKRFVKSKELTDAFSQTDAFSELFVELAQNADAANEFIKGVIPAPAASQLPAAK